MLDDMRLRVGLDVCDLGGSRVRPLDARASLAAVDAAVTAGLDTAWLPVLEGGPDPLVLCALATGRPIELATGVVRVWSQHPVELARAAATVGALATHGFVLGVGVSHRGVVDGTYGTRFRQPARYLDEYLTVLRALVDTGTVAFVGDLVTAHTDLDQRAAGLVTLAAAAGGPRMLAAAGRSADVVMTNLVGVRTLASRSVPTATRAAQEAGRARPRIASVFPVCVTERVDDGRAHVDRVFARYAATPEYRVMLDAEGAAATSDIALIGDEDALAAGLARLADAGVTDLVASVTAASDEERARTMAALAAVDRPET